MGIKFIHAIFCVLLAAWLAACPKPALKEVPAEAEEPVSAEQTARENPRVAASLQLTDQGRRLLDEHKPDKAISVLEQALSLHPTNGRNYYYLAEAWLMKGSAAQAKEFNALAEIHLKEDPAWMIRVAKQADRIAELEK
ncbi:MAG: tetratricopeptide repeat protein [Deltaproteobacteria bacterium]|jgi:cytochrome c-type biogenesis protein CcmH/NrfG